jgi:isoleucyl-tRNA synthetase
MTYPTVSTTGQHTGAAFGVPSSPRFPQIEEAVLAYWAKDNTFQASVEERPAGVDGANEFVFYDGPPFANGLPHYGHLLTGYVKDIVPRYETMRGKHVERRFGWDTHGLPAELEAMSQLGIKTKDEILEIGHRDLQRQVPRVGHEVHRGVAGLRHPPGPLGRLRQRLQDLNPTFMESVLWAFKTAVRQGPGLRGLPRACPTAGTTRRRCPTTSCAWTRTSTRTGRTPRSPWATASRPASSRSSGRRPRGPCRATSRSCRAPRHRLRRRRVRGPDGRAPSATCSPRRAWLPTRASWGRMPRERVVERLTGADLVGRSYTPPFSYYAGHPKAFTWCSPPTS